MKKSKSKRGEKKDVFASALMELVRKGRVVVEKDEEGRSVYRLAGA